MRVRLTLEGDGSELAPHRVDLPSYNMISKDEVNEVAIVEVSRADIPLSVSGAAGTSKVVLDGASVIVRMDGSTLGLWWSLLDRRYGDRVGPFRPTPV